MGFVSGVEALGGGDIISGLTGETAGEAATQAATIQAQAGREAIEAQERATERAQGFFEPFAGAAERGVEASGFLADPQAQFEFLQSNPLFQLALENANQRTLQSASASRRLSFGDTLQQLSSNVLLQAAPLIDRQRADVTNLLNLGAGVAGSQANIEIGQAANIGNLTTDIGATQAGGVVGAANAQTAGTQNLLNALLTGGAIAASDIRLKTDVKPLGQRSDHNWYSWVWNELAEKLFGLTGMAEGVIAQEVMITHPQAVLMIDDYYHVNYGRL